MTLGIRFSESTPQQGALRCGSKTQPAARASAFARIDRSAMTSADAGHGRCRVRRRVDQSTQNENRAPNCAWNEIGIVVVDAMPPRYPFGWLYVAGENALPK